jgi:hypothetical protein
VVVDECVRGDVQDPAGSGEGNPAPGADDAAAAGPDSADDGLGEAFRSDGLGVGAGVGRRISSWVYGLVCETTMMGVLTQPGYSTPAVMPVPAISARNERTKLSTAALDIA